MPELEQLLPRTHHSSVNSTMALLLYKKDISPPCRAVLLTAKALELEMELRELGPGENKEDSFLEMNPEHTVPVLDDNGFIVLESHAIIKYLADKYGGDEKSLYPEDIETRARIDHKLFFNCSRMQTLFYQIVGPFLFQGDTGISDQLVDKTIEVYGFLETFLGDREWLVGDAVTIADIVLIPSVTSFNIFIPIEDSFPKLSEWLERVQELPFYEANAEGLAQMKQRYDEVVGQVAANEDESAE